MLGLAQAQAALGKDVGAIRLSCKQWRDCVSQTVTAVSASGLCEQRPGPDVLDVGNLFWQLPCLKKVDSLPFKYLTCLPSRLQSQLTGLTLEGTGTDAIYSLTLPQFSKLQHISFLGPVTMTDQLLVALGNLPELCQLTFRHILFPRTAYQASVLGRCKFALLQCLTLEHPDPLSCNGSDSIPAGRQFLLSLQALRHITVNVHSSNSSSQTLRGILDTLPELKRVNLLIYRNQQLQIVLCAACKAGAWRSWARGNNVQFREDWRLK